MKTGRDRLGLNRLRKGYGRAADFCRTKWTRTWAASTSFWNGVAERLQRSPQTVRWVLVSVALLLCGGLLFLAQQNWNWARGTVASIASDRIHRPVPIDGDLRVYLFSWYPSATVEGLKIGQPTWTQQVGQPAHMADIGRLALQAELAPMILGRLVLPRLEIDQPNVALLQNR